MSMADSTDESTDESADEVELELYEACDSADVERLKGILAAHSSVAVNKIITVSCLNHQLPLHTESHDTHVVG
jgi:hypothetical protein